MFFNTRKKKELEKAKELADAILNTFKTGLFNTKYHKTVDQFTLPPNIFKDIYISGFVEHFISLSLNYFYKEIKTSNSNADFLLNVYKNLGLNKDEIELYSQLLTNEKIRKDWDAADGRYTLGKEHARLCFCCMFNIFTIEENSELLPKAKKIAKNMPNIIGNETYEVKLTTAMCELTIYDYLQKHFGGVLIGKYDSINDKKQEIIKDKNSESVDQTNQIKQIPFIEFKKRVIRNLRVFYDIKINLSDKKNNRDFDNILYAIYDENLNSIVGAIISANQIYDGDLLKLIEKFDYEKVIHAYNKSKLLIKEFDIKIQDFPKNDNFSYVNSKSFIEHANNRIDTAIELMKSEGEEKYSTEQILTEIFFYHRSLIVCAKNSINPNKKSKSNPNFWIKKTFEKTQTLKDLFKKLESLKNEDYVNHVKELLLLEDSLQKVSQQKIYNEFKEWKWDEKLSDHNLIKELILKDFDKLKI